MADLIIINGNIWTGVRGAPRAQALAIVGERIAAVSSNEAIRALAGANTKTIDARGRLVVPGITDAHVHLIGGGLQLSRVDLRDAKDRAEFVRRLAERAKTLRPGEWILGGQWTVDSWADPANPRKEWVDAATPHTPIFLTRMDGHQALANSAALKLAGIDAKGPPDPQGGIIERDAKTGEPTGILKDDAMNLISARIPPPSAEERTAALRAAMDHLHRFGVTGVHDMSDPDDLPVYAQARAAGTLTLRIHSFLQVSDWSKYFDTVAKYPRDDSWWRVAGFKGYMDGSLGSRSAFMREPYSDAGPDNKYPRGLLVDQADPFEEFQQQILRADAAGLQLAVHAIGDEAIHLILGGYDAVRRTNAPRDRRHRIEHAQHLLPEDIARFAKLGVIASMQPLHKADDGRWAEKALGPKRSQTTYAFRSLLDAGATVAFGSDWPVVESDPFAGMAAAVTGRTLDGKVWVPEQNVTAEQALTAYTVTPAYAAYQERSVGTLEAGKLADVVILSQDVLTIPPEKLAATHADVTVVAGRIAWSAE